MIPTIILLIALLNSPLAEVSATVPVASHTMSMTNRYGNEFVNGVFRDNILLTLRYMSGEIETKDQINWDEVNGDYSYQFTLNPGEGFAFHDTILPKYKGVIVKTTEAHFNYADGFKSDGYLMGDGVCHLASIIYWSAKDAGLETLALHNHDFAAIPEVPKEYGVGIYNVPSAGQGAESNLYIVNNKEKPVHFVFDYKDNNLTVAVTMDK